MPWAFFVVQKTSSWFFSNLRQFNSYSSFYRSFQQTRHSPRQCFQHKQFIISMIYDLCLND